MGTFIQIKWEGDKALLIEFWKQCNTSFEAENWGYDPLMKGVRAPDTDSSCYVGMYLICCLQRPIGTPGRYLVNSIDIRELLKPIN